MDWRKPENRREAFQRFYSFHLKYKSHPGCVYSLLPAIAEAYNLDDDQRAWLVWLNGNTQNAVTSLLLLEAAPHSWLWPRAVDFWNDHFKDLEWDTDRRHQKSRFGEATERWASGVWGSTLAAGWYSQHGWSEAWPWARSHPFMGRLSAWSMTEYARILLGPAVPDANTWLLEDVDGSRSHRNGLAVVSGYPGAEHWDADIPQMLGIVGQLAELGDSLLDEAKTRNFDLTDVTRLTMESALCTYKSWHKPNRRYPNVYADMMYNRIKRAESRFGHRFDLLWETRKRDLIPELRLEDQPYDPGLSPIKQNWYRTTGEIPLLHLEWRDMEPSGFDRGVATHRWTRKDPKWN